MRFIMRRRGITEIRRDMREIYNQQPDRSRVTIEADKKKINRLLKEMEEAEGERNYH
jgi:hypothetical protein